MNTFCTIDLFFLSSQKPLGTTLHSRVIPQKNERPCLMCFPLYQINNDTQEPKEKKQSSHDLYV